MSQTLLQPEILDSNTANGRWMVVIFNNDTNTVDEVVDALIRATGCTIEEAEIETWEAHVYGSASVHFAGKDECDTAATIISAIGVKTEVTREWDD